MLFKEEQHVNRWKVVPVILLAVAGLLFSFFRQPDDGASKWFLLGMLLLVTGISVLMLRAKLETQIDRYAIKYRFFPFINSWRRIEKEQITSLEVAKYSPILEYGGYGYRFSIKNGRALNVAGNKGLKIVNLKNKKLLIGTQKPEEMEQAINQFLNENQE